MSIALSYVIPVRRRHLGLSQADLARLVGVTRNVISLWEGRRRPVPERYLPALATALHVSLEELTSLYEPALVGRKPMPGWAPRSTPLTRPPYARICKAPLASMLTLGPTAGRLHEAALKSLGPGVYEVLCAAYPRDTVHELLLVHHAAARRAGLFFLSLRRLGCTQLIISGEENQKWVYEGDAAQPALAWRTDRELLVLFGQVTLAIPAQGRRYRVDFLMRYTGPSGKAHWMYVEIDGGFHSETANQDARRAVGIGLSELRYENQAVLRPDFFGERLMKDIRRRVDHFEKGSDAPERVVVGRAFSREGEPAA